MGEKKYLGNRMILEFAAIGSLQNLVLHGTNYSTEQSATPHKDIVDAIF